MCWAPMAGIYGSCRRPRASSRIAKWSPDGTRVVFYELAVADTFRARGLGAQAAIESRIVSVDVATGARAEHASGPGLKLSPQFLDSNRVGYLAKSGASAALAFSSGGTARAATSATPPGRTMAARLCFTADRSSHSGSPRARRLVVWPTPGVRARFASGFPAVSPTDDKLPSASEPDGGTPTIGPRWSSGIRMARTHGASSTPKDH